MDPAARKELFIEADRVLLEWGIEQFRYIRRSLPSPPSQALNLFEDIILPAGPEDDDAFSEAIQHAMGRLNHRVYQRLFKEEPETFALLPPEGQLEGYSSEDSSDSPEPGAGHRQSSGMSEDPDLDEPDWY